MKFKVFIFSFLVFLMPLVSSAQIPFGGKITSVVPCLCSGGWNIIIYDLVTMTPISLVFQMGFSRLNANYNIFTPGVWLVGTYTPGGICIYINTEGNCRPRPVIGTITPFPFSGVGTSAY